MAEFEDETLLTATELMTDQRIDVYLICGGNYHDFDFARVELLKLLQEHDRIRVRVAENYSDVQAIRGADCLISYTCNIVPSAEEQVGLEEFLNAGKRWFALHGTNSILEIMSTRPLKIDTPRRARAFMEILGSQFLAHPPIDTIAVKISAPEHPLVAGIEPFETEDELYLSEYHGDNIPLLHCDYQGSAPEFVHSEWSGDESHLVFYLHPYGDGEVLYLTLGHCRGRYDMRPLMEEYPRVERCSWELPVYYELLRRGIRWATRL